MTLTLPPPLASALSKWAAVRRMPPDELALELLNQRLLPEPPEPRSEWERQLLSAAMPCGVTLTDEQLSREVIYD